MIALKRSLGIMKAEFQQTPQRTLGEEGWKESKQKAGAGVGGWGGRPDGPHGSKGGAVLLQGVAQKRTWEPNGREETDMDREAVVSQVEWAEYMLA